MRPTRKALLKFLTEYQRALYLFQDQREAQRLALVQKKRYGILSRLPRIKEKKKQERLGLFNLKELWKQKEKFETKWLRFFNNEIRKYAKEIPEYSGERENILLKKGNEYLFQLEKKYNTFFSLYDFSIQNAEQEFNKYIYRWKQRQPELVQKFEKEAKRFIFNLQNTKEGQHYLRNEELFQGEYKKFRKSVLWI